MLPCNQKVLVLRMLIRFQPCPAGPSKPCTEFLGMPRPQAMGFLIDARPCSCFIIDQGLWIVSYGYKVEGKVEIQRVVGIVQETGVVDVEPSPLCAQNNPHSDGKIIICVEISEMESGGKVGQFFAYNPYRLTPSYLLSIHFS